MGNCTVLQLQLEVTVYTDLRQQSLLVNVWVMWKWFSEVCRLLQSAEKKRATLSSSTTTTSPVLTRRAARLWMECAFFQRMATTQNLRLRSTPTTISMLKLMRIPERGLQEILFTCPCESPDWRMKRSSLSPSVKLWMVIKS